MTAKNKEHFFIFYAANVVILGEATEMPTRHYEDDKIEISRKKTIYQDDTILIKLKDPGNTRVFEVALCQLQFKQQGLDQVHLTGEWELYLTQNLLEKAIEKLRSHHQEVEDFEKFCYKNGPGEDNDVLPVRTGEINDYSLFKTNVAQA